MELQPAQARDMLVSWRRGQLVISSAIPMAALMAALALFGCNEKSPSASQCFHVSYASQGVLPATAMRWNSCTGETWLLLEQDVEDAGGKRTGGMWGWFPVIVQTDVATGK